jgi:hypothetical protein
MPVELFRYRYNGADGGQYEAVFETDEQSMGKTVDKEKRWPGCRLSTANRLERYTQTYFVVILPDGTVVEPRVVRRL